MPSRRQSSEMFSSPRSPSSTMRIFSSAEYCRRVWRRMFFSTCSAGGLSGPDFCFIFAPCGYDEPEVLPSGSPSIGLTGADGGHPDDVRHQIIDLALEVPELSPRELAVRFTDQKKYFVSEASVYRLLKAHDLITSPAYVVIVSAQPGPY